MDMGIKVVHLSHTDGASGAGRAAYRIHKSLLDIGVDSTMLVSQKRSLDPRIFSITGTIVGRFLVKLNEYLESRAARFLARDKSVFLSLSRYSQFKTSKFKQIVEADVVALYWVNGAFMSPEDIKRIKQPLIWRLSDVWPFTGGCHYPSKCENFEQQCGHCPQLKSPSEKDATWNLWKRKFDSYKGLDLTIVAPSNWMAGLVKRSSLFVDFHIEVIPTGVDLEVYRPMDTVSARLHFQLPLDCKIILFGAMGPEDDRRKGYQELLIALKTVADSSLSENIVAVLFGSNSDLNINLPVTSVSVGRLDNDSDLAKLYSCADIVAVPSLEDNLPNIALEALACGVPVVGFNVCGMPDIVKNGYNGRLVDVDNPEELGNAMIDILSSSKALSKMNKNAREYAELHFDLKNQALAFKGLYNKLLSK
jgi:glycosyltransferase involved in cell wall biosynthesis